MKKNVQDITPEQVTNILSNVSLYMIVITILSILSGVITIIIIKNKARSAGILLITTSILSSVLTIFLGILGGIAYLIAGIAIIMKDKKVRNQTDQSF